MRIPGEAFNTQFNPAAPPPYLRLRIWNSEASNNFGQLPAVPNGKYYAVYALIIITIK